MIRLGLRLVLSGGREALTRLVVLAAAVGLGVGLLLTAVAATNAAVTWNNRHGWFWTGTSSVAAGPAADIAPLWWHPSADTFDGRPVSRFDVAATGASSPVPPGLPRDPAPGTYFASPALAALLRSTPADQLADRYPGRLAGVISDTALPSPASLVIVIGRTPAQLAHTADSAAVTSIPAAVPGNFGGQVNPRGLSYFPPDPGGEQSAVNLLLSVVALAILTPVLIFIGTATRLSAARREQRFAAMRLVGATRRQVSLLAATESTAAALLGVAAGFGMFFLLRIPVAGIPFIGQPFFPSELTLSGPDILAVAIGVPLAAVVAAQLALHRVHISPLGVARKATPSPPRAWRVLPLLAGFAELGFFMVHGKPSSPSGEDLAFVPSFALIIVGLVLAGPWLTVASARILARRTRRPGTLIAARRLADDPKSAFRAVSGLVLALFVTTVAVLGITTWNAQQLRQKISAAEATVLTDQMADQQPGSVPGPARPAAPLAAELAGIGGVQGVVVVREDQGLTIPAAFHGLGAAFGSTGPVPAGVVSCAQLAGVPALGRCPAGAAAAAFPADGFGRSLELVDATGITWPAADVGSARLDGLAVDAIDVGTNGTVAATEQARTVLEGAHAYPAPYLGDGAPSTVAELIAQSSPTNTGYQQLANTVILVSLPIAGCTLAAGIAAGLADRKRPFSMMRLTGARLATLRRVVALESAVPLLAAAAVAIGTGFAATAMYSSLEMQRSVAAPGTAYYFLTVGGILAALGIIAATFPLLARITGPEVARNE